MRVLLVLALVCYAYAWHEFKDMSSNQEDSSEHGIAPGRKQTSCECGRANRAVSRIVNGVETDVNQFPFVVGLTKRRRLFIFCGGTIVSVKHAITAAHCTHGEDASKLAVVVGAHDVTNSREKREIVNMASFQNHEGYEPDHDHHDICLITLEKSLTFTRTVSPACLPHSSQSYNLNLKYVKVMGWGKTQTDGPTSYWLRHTNLRVIPLDTCRTAFRKHIPAGNWDNQVCTYGRNRDTCQGDSGGPVLYVDPETNRYTLVGLVSYGAECATVTPGVNTKVEAYLDWIHKNMKGTKTCSKVN